MSDLSAMYDEVRAAYQLLITDADSLANRKLLDGQRLEAARDIQGYQALIKSTLVLVNVLRDRRGRARDVEPAPTPSDDLVPDAPGGPFGPSPNNGGPPFTA